MAELESRIIATLQSIFDQFGWFGVAGLLVFENATSLTPSEIILGLAGWMLLAAHDAPPAMVRVAGLYAALGSATGSSVTYWLVRLGGRPAVDRVTCWLRIDPRDILRAEALFNRWGPGLYSSGACCLSCAHWSPSRPGWRVCRFSNSLGSPSLALTCGAH